MQFIHDLREVVVFLHNQDKKRQITPKKREKMMINPRDEYLINKGRKEGRKEEKQEVAKKLLDKIPIEEITEITGLTEKEIKNLI